MFKVNNKDNRKTSVVLVFLLSTWKKFHTGVSIFHFEQVNAAITDRANLTDIFLLIFFFFASLV